MDSFEPKTSSIPLAIPEFYYDFITRIIPGALAIAAYKWELVTSTNQLSTVFVAILGIYSLGLSVHISTLWLWTEGVKLLQGALKRGSIAGINKSRFTRWVDRLALSQGNWERIRRLPPNFQAVYVKKMAEVGLFRNFMVLLIAFSIWLPSDLPDVILTRLLLLWAAVMSAFFSVTVDKWIDAELSNLFPRGSRHS